MRGQEVSIRMVRDLVPGYERHGIQCAPLMNGLGFSSTDMQDPSKRIAWDDFIEFMERLCQVAGGHHALADLVCTVMEANPLMQLLAGAVINPRRLYLLACERVSRKMYSHIGVRVEYVGDDSVRVVSAIPKGYRPSLAFHYASLGCMRAYPRLLGLADAVIDAEISPYQGVFLATPPPSRTLGSLAMERLRQLLPTGLLGTGNQEGPVVALDESEIVESVVPVGQEMAWQTEASALGELFLHFMRQRFCVRHAAMWMNRTASSPAELVCSCGEDTLQQRLFRTLLVGGIEVGRVEVDLPTATAGERLPLFEAILPWLALGAANVLRSCPAVQDPVQRTSSGSQRLQELIQSWSLTPRESQVLQMVMAGSANKEIATGLGTSVKTVEFHVRGLLRKVGVDSRGALMARLLSEDRSRQ